MKKKLHEVPIEIVYEAFSSNPSGLTSDAVVEARKQYGSNILSEKKRLPMILRFLLQFKNFFSLLLLVGAALSFFGHSFSPGDGFDLIGYALVGVTFLNALFTFFQEYKAEQVMRSFRNLLPETIGVLRDGQEVRIDAKEIVPGDVLFLREGDKVPADGRIIENHLLRVDHSMLTGESEPQLRSTKASSSNPLVSRNMVFSGTLIQAGSGKAVVLSTGDATEIGKIANLTKTVKAKDSKIRREIKDFVKVISGIALLLGIVFFGLGFVVGRTFWESLIFGIGIIVANVPEGLLPTVTLTLSLSAQRMAKKKAFVKDIESIETVGGITTICTDKTGTLTENRLSVSSLIYNNLTYTFDSFHKTFYDKKNVHYLHTADDDYFNKLLDTLFHCNNAVVQKNNVHGDPTEIALKEAVITQKDVIAAYEDTKREEEIPFDSEKKYMITAIRHDEERIAYMKGSPEIVVKKSKKIILNNKIVSLTDKRAEEFLEYNKSLANEGKRILAIAYKDLDSKASTPDLLEEDEYVLLGLIALQDPPRKEVAQAVKECYQAGVRIVVISGDQALTVRAIAEQVGIVRDHEKPLVFTSDDLAKLNDHELKEILKKKEALIFARSLPEDKLRIVKLLQELDEIVAVTGDGVNDAPALKQADVGLAMGKSGTDVAKDAANIVLLDDNFATIVEAVKSGRTVFENIKKFILYILTSNIPQILPFLFFVLLGWPLALPVLLILAIDLGTDMLPGISLGLEKSERDVMKQKPRSPRAKLLTKSMLFRSYGFVGPIQAATAFVVFFMTLFAHGWSFGTPLPMSSPIYMSAVTAYFAAIIITQVFDLTSCRTMRVSALKKSFAGNRLFFIGIVTELLLLLCIIFLPPLKGFFGTAPFDPLLIPLMILGGIVILGVEELRKSLHRKHGMFAVR